MKERRAERLYGTLNLLILQVLADGPRHGLDVLREIEGRGSDDELLGLQIEEGALYPALHRLERDGLIAGEWGLSQSKRRAKFYRRTAKGAKRLVAEREGWIHHTRAVARVLDLQLDQLIDAEVAGT